MNKGVILCSLTAALLGSPIMAWADANPDFDDDAKPILRAQPGLLNYVESRFEVKDTGTAKYPGDDDRRPGPPYIFRARPIGSNGPFNLRLLIQPGPPGHILGVVDITKVHVTEPGSAPVPQAPPQVAQQPVEPPSFQSPALSQGEVKPLPPQNTSQPAQNPAPAPEQSSPPTADTPSGPIMGPDSSGSPSNPPSLAPPPDPAPSNQ
jgi:hypothetical protein